MPKMNLRDAEKDIEFTLTIYPPKGATGVPRVEKVRLGDLASVVARLSMHSRLSLN